MFASFNRFEVEMSRKTAEACSHPGPCDADVKWAIDARKVKFHRMTPEALRAELHEEGAWDNEELADHDANIERIVWIAAGNIVEELRSKA